MEHLSMAARGIFAFATRVLTADPGYPVQQ
jgi:hypothetical protein